MNDVRYELDPVGWVESPLVDPESAPLQGDEGAPNAWLVFNQNILPGLTGLSAGQEVILLTWLDRADRDVLLVRSRGDESRPETGVFSVRSSSRPNPIGLHPVQILAIDGNRMLVSRLEALNGTPILDVKPVLGRIEER